MSGRISRTLSEMHVLSIVIAVVRQDFRHDIHFRSCRVPCLYQQFAAQANQPFCSCAQTSLPQGMLADSWGRIVVSLYSIMTNVVPAAGTQVQRCRISSGASDITPPKFKHQYVALPCTAVYLPVPF